MNCKGPTIEEALKRQTEGYRPRGGQYAGAGFQTFNHPPLLAPVNLPKDILQFMPNRFAYELYLKYPNLVPQLDFPDRPDDYFRRKYRYLDNYVTTYKKDFRTKESYFEEPLLERGQSIMEAPDSPTRYLPNTTYPPPETRANIYPSMTKRQKKIQKQEEMSKMRHPLPRLSEYNANINRVGQFIMKKKIHTNYPAIGLPNIVPLDNENELE